MNADTISVYMEYVNPRHLHLGCDTPNWSIHNDLFPVPTSQRLERKITFRNSQSLNLLISLSAHSKVWTTKQVYLMWGSGSGQVRQQQQAPTLVLPYLLLLVLVSFLFLARFSLGSCFVLSWSLYWPSSCLCLVLILCFTPPTKTTRKKDLDYQVC